MDPFSGAAAAVSLAIQLAGTVQTIRRFLHNIKNAPKELSAINHLLDQLHQNLSDVAKIMELQRSLDLVLDSHRSVTNALTSCHKNIKMLEDPINKAEADLAGRHRLQKGWKSLRILSKKDEVQVLQFQLRDAIMALQMAVSTNSAEFQVHHMQLTTAGFQQFTLVQNRQLARLPEQPTVSSFDSVEHQSNFAVRKNSTIIAKSHNVTWYWGVLGSVHISTHTKYTKKLRSSCVNSEQPVTGEKVLTLRPSFLRYEFDLSFDTGFRWIPRNLRIYEVISQDAPIFGFVIDGDLSALQGALQQGVASPFVSDERGHTLLHWAAVWCRADICRFLIGVGVAVDRFDDYGTTAIGSSCYEQYSSTSARDAVDTLRLLAQHQEGDMNETDLCTLLQTYAGPAEGVDLLMSMDMLCIEADSYSWRSVLLLETALGLIGKFPEWESIVRRLLRRGLDPHAHCFAPTKFRFEDEEPNALANGGFIATPLDELFESTDSPVEARMVAQRWLEILKSEGHDIRTYLETEKTVHGPQPYITFSWKGRRDQTLRQMVFEMETDPPGVCWDWWTDPKSGAALVLEEFKSMNGLCQRSFGGHRAHWTESWPFGGLDLPRRLWAVNPSEMYRDQMRTQRWRRKYAKKLARANGKRNYPYNVPGAWSA